MRRVHEINVGIALRAISNIFCGAYYRQVWNSSKVSNFPDLLMKNIPPLYYSERVFVLRLHIRIDYHFFVAIRWSILLEVPTLISNLTCNLRILSPSELQPIASYWLHHSCLSQKSTGVVFCIDSWRTKDALSMPPIWCWAVHRRIWSWHNRPFNQYTRLFEDSYSTESEIMSLDMSTCILLQ